MTTAPKRIQLSRAKGWRMPPNTVKVDQSTRWGNPFVRHADRCLMEREMAVQAFRLLLTDVGVWWSIPLPWPKGKISAKDPTTVEDVQRELRGKNLACWCPLDKPCHADVLLEIANREPGA